VGFGAKLGVEIGVEFGPGSDAGEQEKESGEERFGCCVFLGIYEYKP
jgi:hypothetical protein